MYEKSNTTNDKLPTLYVVTRDGRRTSDKNFLLERDARNESDYWIRLVRKYDPRSKISIAKTTKPKRIR